MKHARFSIIVLGVFVAAVHGQDRASRIDDLAKQLTETQKTAVALQKTIDSLSDELESLRKTESAPKPEGGVNAPQKSGDSEREAFKIQILVPDLGADERSTRLTARPELFVQSRYSALPLRNTNVLTAPTNFELARMESRWSGAVSDKIGMGFEIQYEPVRLSPWLRQRVKTLFAVRCKFIVPDPGTVLG